MVFTNGIVAIIYVSLLGSTSFGFAPGFSTLTVRPGHTFCEALSASAGDDQGSKDEGSKDEGSEDDATCGKKTKFVDDGTRAGPETLTDRFKYSVNALMGNYDPEEGEDSEEAVADTFAIADALVKEKGGWPAVFDFVAVGSVRPIFECGDGSSCIFILTCRFAPWLVAGRGVRVELRGGSQGGDSEGSKFHARGEECGDEIHEGFVLAEGRGREDTFLNIQGAGPGAEHKIQVLNMTKKHQFKS